jgi:hypothetical protein
LLGRFDVSRCKTSPCSVRQTTRRFHHIYYIMRPALEAILLELSNERCCGPARLSCRCSIILRSARLAGSLFCFLKGLGLCLGVRLASISGANFDTGRVAHWGYVGTPPGTLAYLCAHELTHIIAWEQCRSGAPSCAAMGMGGPSRLCGHREPFEQLRDALGDQPVDIPMMM